MRERSRLIFWAAGRPLRGLAVLPCAAIVFAGVVAGLPNAGSVVEILGDLVVAPAHAGKGHRRWSNRRRGNDLQASTSQGVQQAEDAQRRAEEAQKRVQQIQEAVAAHQRRLEQLQQNALPQQKAEQIQRRIQQTEALQKRLQGMSTRQQGSSLGGADHHRRIQDSVERVQRHHALVQNYIAKARGSFTHGSGNDRSKLSKFGGMHRHHVILRQAMGQLRYRHHGERRKWGHGSRHDQVRRHIWSKLSHRSREKENDNSQSTKQTSNKGPGGGLLNAPIVASVAAPIVAKLPDVAGSNASSRSDSGMSRLGGPKNPKDADKDDDDDSGLLKQTGRGAGGRITGALLPSFETFARNEVLALNFSGPRLQKAIEKKFRVIERIPLPALGFELTRLETPRELNALIGRSTLYEMFPDDGFGLNRIYSTGRPAAGDPVKSAAVPGPGSSGVVVRPGAGCTPDRCFGNHVIRWQPQLAACARDIRIGVIDTGVDKSHPAFADLKRDKFNNETFIPNDAKKASNVHGTAVFSLLAGSAHSSTPGLVPDATFFVADAFFADQAGNAMSNTVTMLRALNWLKDSNVDVANLSFAGPEDDLVHDAIRKLARTGTVILAAAGNEGQDAPPSYPAAYPEVIAVTAVDRKLNPYMYASSGNHIAVAAPGVDVWTALPNRREGPQSGTSFAVPFVTSIVALSYRVDHGIRHNPLEPRRRALDLLQKDIRTIGGRDQAPIYGAGLVQAPAHCDPRNPDAVAGGWTGTVHVVPAAVPARGVDWTGTVRR